MDLCDFCGAQSPVHPVKYWQNTGLLLMRRSTTYEGNACRSCSGKVFRKATIHNLLFGWWGMISLFLTPIFIWMNVACWAKSRALAPAKAAARKQMEG